MVRRKDNPANNPNQKSLFEIKGFENMGKADNITRVVGNKANTEHIDEDGFNTEGSECKYNKEIEITIELKKAIDKELQKALQPLQEQIESLKDIIKTVAYEDNSKDREYKRRNISRSNGYKPNNRPYFMFEDEDCILNNPDTSNIDQPMEVKQALEDYILSLYYKRKEEIAGMLDFSKYEMASCVKDVLDEMGVKTSWLQERTQIPTSTLRSIITNANAISLENAFRISKVLNMPIEKLFMYENVVD